MGVRYQDFLENEKDTFELLLSSYGVKFRKVEKQTIGFYDIYDVTLSVGMRISKIDSVLAEIGLHLQALERPRGYPLTRKGVYRIEVQREDIKPKPLTELLKNDTHNEVIPTCLGTKNSGEDFIIDLNSVPHLLIGGTTGSGKSVLLHNIILSQMKNNADIYLVDPKFVEFSMYKYTNSVLRIDNSIEQFKITLSVIFDEMNRRYEFMNKFRVRNIKEYNDSVFTYSKFKPIVIVIDEWADFHLQDKTLQNDLCLIAQKGRASGISIVLATQRPSVNVISGLIKANFPGRVCLRVASSVDSKVILDKTGGEELSSSGSGLYLDGSFKMPVKFRTPYVKNIANILGGLDGAY